MREGSGFEPPPAPRVRRGWRVVFCKEIVENARDRRALSSALLYGPLLGPVLFAAMMAFILGQQREDAEKQLELPVAGAEHAPNLVRFLETQGIVVVTAPADPEAAVCDQQQDVILVIPPDFGERWSRGEPAVVELLQDQSRRRARIPVDRVTAQLERYAAQIGLLRLQLRGIAPQLASPLIVADRDLSTPQSRAGLMMAMLPYFLVLSAFVGGMYLAIDTTAGERERQSLEPLLITPQPRAQIMAGKLLATAVYAAASLLIGVLAFAIAIRFVPTAQLGFELSLSPAAVALICAVILPVALLASSAQTVVASFSKSFREAQTYLQFLILVPAVPSIIMAASPMRAEPWTIATPLFSQSVLIYTIARGEPVTPGEVLLSVATTLLLAVALGWIAVRLYRREQVVFGG
ncbi:MAG: ABC transporter permease [Pseudomonadota bacterium]